jgi:hypothetical protein
MLVAEIESSGGFLVSPYSVAMLFTDEDCPFAGGALLRCDSQFYPREMDDSS